jgi:hypothetical protein
MAVSACCQRHCLTKGQPCHVLLAVGSGWQKQQYQPGTPKQYHMSTQHKDGIVVLRALQV